MAPRVGRYLIYGLLDPRDCSLRYVGKTHLRREIRLARHLEAAAAGASAPVSGWIRDLAACGLCPVIFVLRRLGPDEDWRAGERNEIERWRAWSPDALPVDFPPQTRRSFPVEIRRVALLNVRRGGWRRRCLRTHRPGEEQALSESDPDPGRNAVRLGFGLGLGIAGRRRPTGAAPKSPGHSTMRPKSSGDWGAWASDFGCKSRSQELND